MTRDFDYYIGAAQEAHQRSTDVWKLMNGLIAEVLKTSRRRGKTLRETADILNKIAGPKKRGGLKAIDNLRITARQIRADRELTLFAGEVIEGNVKEKGVFEGVKIPNESDVLRMIPNVKYNGRFSIR